MDIPGIAYTYTEPTIFFEYACDTMKLAKKEGLYNVWVSNGYIQPEAVKKISKYLDAINVDIKGNKEFYRKVCRVPNPEAILEALKLYKKLGVFIEVTNLIIPGYNDSEKDIKGMVSWIKNNLGEDTPLHFSRFFPDFRMRDVPPTPVETLEKAWRIAHNAGMKWVYIGNVVGHEKENTFCPKCGNLLVSREGYVTKIVRQRCKCGERLLIKGKKWVNF